MRLFLLTILLQILVCYSASAIVGPVAPATGTVPTEVLVTTPPAAAHAAIRTQDRTTLRQARRALRKQLRAERVALRAQAPKRPKKPKTGDGMAVASLVLGILGIAVFNFLVLSVLAIIFGAIARKRYKQGYHDRGKMAKAGLILGIIGAGIFVITYGILLLLIASWGG